MLRIKCKILNIGRVNIGSSLNNPQQKFTEEFAHVDHLKLVIFSFIYITKLRIGPILYKNQQLIKSNKTRFF